MATSPDAPDDAFAARHRFAVERLRDALALDAVGFVDQEVTRRLRDRPHFFGRMQPGPRASLRQRVDADSLAAVERLAQPVTDLRVYFGAEPRTVAEEDAAFTRTVTEAIVGVARRLLTELAFPGDDKPDRADITAMDLDAEYQLSYQPSPTLVWAWRRVRELDGVRNQVADGDVTDGFERRWHLPERGPAA
ncbi:MAG: hypothetical protein R3B06_06795 [Kofleriaceae bacterium]